MRNVVDNSADGGKDICQRKYLDNVTDVQWEYNSKITPVAETRLCDTDT